MATRPRLPQFGEWDNQDNVPYTMAFDKARKGRVPGGKMINPNDPQENHELFASMGTAPSSQSANAPPPSRNRTQMPEGNGRGGPVKPPREPRVSREERGNPRQSAPSPSPARNENFASSKTAPGESVHQQHSSHGSHRPPRQSAGSEYSFERSPMHPVYQNKLGGRGSASPAWEGKNTNDSSHGASAGKSRIKPPSTRVDESPDRSAAVPRFGDWDESNPQGGDYTNIFNKVREERNQTPSHDEGRRTPSSYRPSHRPNADGGSKGCCFPLFGKWFS